MAEDTNTKESNVASGIFGGATAGAQVGGPQGAAIGAAGGGLLGILNARAKKKAEERKLAEVRAQDISSLVSKQADQQSGAFATLMANMRAILGG